MDHHKFVTQGPVFNEALAQSTVNLILITCIAEEKDLALGPKQTNLTPSGPSPSRPRMPDPDPETVILFLKFETKLSFEVIYRKEKRLLQGSADCSLWYDKYESMGINLLLVNAKRRTALDSAERQLVAYMGE